MPTEVKICGITTRPALDAAIGNGASHVGFVHFAKSPRHGTLDGIAALRRMVPEHVKAVLLVVDPDMDALRHLTAAIAPDVLQLHGHETPQKAAAIKGWFAGELWKALPVRQRADLAAAQGWRGVADRLLYDAKPPEGADLPGGNGLRFDWAVLDGFAHPVNWGLAGGLDPANVAEAIHTTRAPLVDVSSGVESAPGVKDVDKIAAFCQAARDYAP